MLPRFELVSFLEAAAAARRWREGATNHQDGSGQQAVEATYSPSQRADLRSMATAT